MKNAILMAAGMGTRMRPLTEKMPKPLVPVAGTPMVETVIKALLAANVDQIYIVTGYLGHQFQYLEEKYNNVTLLENTVYESINNISSVYTALDVLKKGDCYICEADLYISDSSFMQKDYDESGYFGKYVEGYSEDWVFEQDEKKRITRVGKGGTDCYNMVGVAFFKEKEANCLAEKIELTYGTQGYEQLFWDDVVNSYLEELNLTVHPVSEEMIVEIDTVHELEEVEEKLALRGMK